MIQGKGHASAGKGFLWSHPRALNFRDGLIDEGKKERFPSQAPCHGSMDIGHGAGGRGVQRRNYAFAERSCARTHVSPFRPGIDQRGCNLKENQVGQGL